METIADKIQILVLNSPRGLRSLTSLYDKSNQAQKMIAHFSHYSQALSNMPELPSITSMLSGKGLYCSFAEIKQCIANAKELGLDIQTVATTYSRKGLPSYDDLLEMKKNLRK